MAPRPAAWTALAAAAVSLALALALCGPQGASAARMTTAVAVHQACGATPLPALTNRTCCGGLFCPFAGGVCCPSGAHCCPANTECVPVGIENVQLCAFFNQTKREMEKWFKESPVKRTEFSVNLTLDISNFVFSFYAKNKDWVQSMLRQDIIRDDPLGMEAVEILNVEPLQLKTEGTAEQEKGVVEKERARLQEEETKRRAAKQKSDEDTLSKYFIKERFAEVRFAPFSGIRVTAAVYATSNRDSESLAHSLWMLKDENLWPLAMLSTLPPDAKGNSIVPLRVLKSSRVFVHNHEIVHKDGDKLAEQARKNSADTANMVGSAAKRIFELKKKLEERKRQDVQDTPQQKENARKRQEKLLKSHLERVKDLKGQDYISDSVPPPTMPPVLPEPLPEVGKNPTVPAL